MRLLPAAGYQARGLGTAGGGMDGQPASEIQVQVPTVKCGLGMPGPVVSRLGLTDSDRELRRFAFLANEYTCGNQAFHHS